MTKDSVLKLRLTAEDHDAIRAAAEARGLSVSALVRQSVLAPGVDVAELIAEMVELRRAVGRSGSAVYQAVKFGAGGEAALELYRGTLEALGDVLRRMPR